MRPFAAFLSSHGIALLATVFVDAQDIITDPAARQGHWHRMAELLRGSATLLSAGNEWFKNGFNPGELSDPGMLWSRRSDVGDAAPFRPYGSFAEFHPRRDLPASLTDSVASPVFQSVMMRSLHNRMPFTHLRHERIDRAVDYRRACSRATG